MHVRLYNFSYHRSNSKCVRLKIAALVDFQANFKTSIQIIDVHEIKFELEYIKSYMF